jgi:hypothetical protein
MKKSPKNSENAKKKTLRSDKQIGNQNTEENLLNDEMIDEELLEEDFLDDDFENDPLLKEAAMLLGKPNPEELQPKKKQIQVRSPNKTQNLTEPRLKKESKSHRKTTKTVRKPVVNKTTMTEFAKILIEKEQIYEEIGFDTILRKLPASWAFTRETIIDLLEAFIQNQMIKSFRMKMTTNSLKFYSLEAKYDKKKE